MNKYVDVLGTRYTIEIHKTNEDDELGNKADGYCNSITRKIVIADFHDLYKDWTEEEIDKYAKQVLRHEIVHAFFSESGLNSNANQFDGAWSRNEEMVDWIAYQFPKMFTVFKEVGII